MSKIRKQFQLNYNSGGLNFLDNPPYTGWPKK